MNYDEKRSYPKDLTGDVIFKAWINDEETLTYVITSAFEEFAPYYDEILKTIRIHKTEFEIPIEGGRFKTNIFDEYCSFINPLNKEEEKLYIAIEMQRGRLSSEDISGKIMRYLGTIISKTSISNKDYLQQGRVLFLTNFKDSKDLPLFMTLFELNKYASLHLKMKTINPQVYILNLNSKETIPFEKRPKGINNRSSLCDTIFLKNLKELKTMGGKGQTKAVDKIEEIFHGPLGTFEERLKRDRASEDDYLREESIKIGIEQGIQQGIEQGIEKEKIETVKRMFKDSLPLKKISEYTGISIEQIKKLK